MSEMLNLDMFPSTLLVLGNGFDLNCKLPSKYENFLENILQEKLKLSSKELELKECTVFEYCCEEIDNYLKQVNFSDVLSVRKSDLVPELNPWYIIFLYKKILDNREWHIVESQISNELLPDKKGLNIVEKIGDLLLGIKFEGRVNYRPQNYAFGKTGEVHTIEKIYELISYCLMYKNLEYLKLPDSYNKYETLRKLVIELGKEYGEIENGGTSNFYQEPLEKFEQKIIDELFPLVAEVLLAELKELEFDFSNYITNSIKELGRDYFDSADILTSKILSICEDEFVGQRKKFNILSFNYTKPWEMRGLRGELFKNATQTVNIHGMIDDTNFDTFNNGYDGIVFGIDDETISPSKTEYMFTKASRTLDLYTDDGSVSKLSHTRLSDLLIPTIQNIIFFGHSLSKADYSYFRMIFDKFLENRETNFIFVYTVFEGTTKENERRKLVQKISSMFGEYSIEKRANTDIFKELIQNKRISIEEI